MPYKLAEIAARGPQKDFNVNECIAVPREQRLCGFNRLDENVMTGLFCGFAPECACAGRMATRRCEQSERLAALERAKHHLYNYSVFGINEYYNVSLRLFERTLPSVFANITALQPIHDNPTGRGQVYAQPTPATLHRLLTEELDLDAQLYLFALEIFNRRMKACFPDLPDTHLPSLMDIPDAAGDQPSPAQHQFTDPSMSHTITAELNRHGAVGDIDAL